MSDHICPCGFHHPGPLHARDCVKYGPLRERIAKREEVRRLVEETLRSDKAHAAQSVDAALRVLEAAPAGDLDVERLEALVARARARRAAAWLGGEHVGR